MAFYMYRQRILCTEQKNACWGFHSLSIQGALWVTELHKIMQSFIIRRSRPVGLMAMLILYLQANRIQRIHELIRLLYIYMRRMKLYAALFTQALGEVKSKGGSAHRVGN